MREHGRFLHCIEEGGTWGKHVFPHVISTSWPSPAPPRTASDGSKTDDRAVGRGGGADRVEHLHARDAVGERRDRHRRVESSRPSTPAPQHLAEPRVRPELEVREPVARVVALARARRAARGRRDRRAHGSPSRSATPHRVALGPEGAVGPGDARRSRRTGPTPPPSAAARPRRRSTQPEAHVRTSPRRPPLACRHHVEPSRSPTRTHRATCGSGRRCANPTRRASPPPASTSNHHARHLGRRGRRRAARTGTKVAKRGSPIAPSAIARPATARSVAHRNSWPTRCVTPGAARRRRACGARRQSSSANGFSQMTCLPGVDGRDRTPARACAAAWRP